MNDTKTQQSLYDDWVERVFGAASRRSNILANAGRADPFWTTVRADLTKVIEILFSEAPVDGQLEMPEDFIRLRAVQEISAAEAVSHIFVLKDLVRERWGQTPEHDRLSQRLDFLALHTFNAYAKCRDNLFRLRLREMAEYGAQETFACRSTAAAHESAAGGAL